MTASSQQPETQSSTTSKQQGFVDPKSYQRAEKLALWYLQDLQQIVVDDEYLGRLGEDYQSWQVQQDQSGSKLNLSDLEAEQHIGQQLDSWSFLQKLSAEKKLKDYLNKSITYIFMRDLGKSITDKDASRQINQTVSQIHRWIKRQSSQSNSDPQQQFSNNWLYRKAKRHGLEKTYFWLINKLSAVQQNMPSELDQTHGMRKLVKIIAGVVMHQYIALPKNISIEEKTKALDQAIRLGYSYGLTYPFIDDLQDSCSALEPSEKELFNQAIRQSLLSGEVVECPTFSQKNQQQMSFIYAELQLAFNTIKSFRSESECLRFFEQAFIFFEAQDIDRQRKLASQHYSIEELFLPIILKSSGCRLIAKEILNSENDESFNHHTFCFGIYNQFNDDIKDIFDDLEEDNVTPYTYYLKQLEQGKQVSVNPYRIYWAVVFYLIYQVYENHPRSKKLLLERSINAHKSLRASLGGQRYDQLTQHLLSTGNQNFDRLIHRLVKMPNDVAWFDKLISRQVAEHFDQQKNHQQQFAQRYQKIDQFITDSLPIPAHSRIKKSQLVDYANYSLQAGGKHLRAAMAYVMCVDRYHVKPKDTVAIIQLLEYMHTASIIFDDKPSQDNSAYRRGQPTLHKKANSEATAELTGVFMMMRAVEVQSAMQGFAPQNILESLRYAANTTQAICEGQLLDLQSKQRIIELQQLEAISELKTGLAIEAALMIPAILNDENDIEKGHIKLFAKHLGLAFQIKDDLLDEQGCSQALGKPVHQDSQQQKASFVTCLGQHKAQQKLFHHYAAALEYLPHLGDAETFMAQVLEFVVHRNH